MTITAKALLGFFVVALVAQLWLWRLDVHPGVSGNAFVLDRWTGRVTNCAGHCYPVYPQTVQEKE
jgi:hypothetical protein